MDKAHLTADALCDLAEGLLPPADRREAEAHLAGCAECRREAAALQGYFREMSGLGTLKAPDRFLTKVHARIAQASPWRRLLAALSSPRLLPVPLMGLAVLLVGVYFAFLSPRFAEQALSGSQAAPPAPVPETVVKLAEKPAPPAEPAAAPPQAGASANAAAEPPSPVAMAPARPPSPAPDPAGEERVATLAKAKRFGRAAAGKAAPSRPKADSAATGSAPVEPEALALGPAGEAAKRSREEKAGEPGAGGSADGKERKLEQERVGWMDNPSAVYILGNSAPAGSDAVIDQITNSRRPAELLEDAPTSGRQAAAAPAAKAETAPGDKAAAPVAAAKAAPVQDEADAEAKARASESRKAGRISELVAQAEPPVRKDRDLRQLEADPGEGYSDLSSDRRRSAPAAAAPPATTPKPWAPLGYTLKSRTADPALRTGLAKLGVKVLRQDNATGRRYELEVPATRIIALETYLGGLGAVTPSPHPLPGRKNGAPILLTLQVVAP